MAGTFIAIGIKGKRRGSVYFVQIKSGGECIKIATSFTEFIEKLLPDPDE
jgi:hypothetical protein